MSLLKFSSYADIVRLAKPTIIGASLGGSMGVLSGGINADTPKEFLTSVGKGALIGAGIGTGARVFGKVISKKVAKEIQDARIAEALVSLEAGLLKKNKRWWQRGK